MLIASEIWGGGEPVQITQAQFSGKGPGVDYVTYVRVFLGSIIICRPYKLTLSDQAKVALQLRVCLCDLE
jgi:hypothetical protein